MFFILYLYIHLNVSCFYQDEGEWEDFKDENDKDYSGLKIQTLSIK